MTLQYVSTAVIFSFFECLWTLAYQAKHEGAQSCGNLLYRHFCGTILPVGQTRAAILRATPDRVAIRTCLLGCWMCLASTSLDHPSVDEICTCELRSFSQQARQIISNKLEPIRDIEPALPCAVLPFRVRLLMGPSRNLWVGDPLRHRART